MGSTFKIGNAPAAASGDASVLSGQTIGTANGSPSVGDPLYFDGTAWQKSTSDTILPTAVFSGSGSITTFGRVTGLNGLTPGAVYYLASGGGLTVTRGTYKIGTAQSSSALLVDIDTAVTVSSGGTAGYAVSGSTTSSYIDKLTFSTETRTRVGTANFSVYAPVGGADTSAGIMVGGDTGSSAAATSTISRMPFSTEVMANTGNVLSSTRTQGGVLSGATYLYALGGYTGSGGTTGIVDRCSYTTGATSIVGATSSWSKNSFIGCAKSSTQGYGAGGANGSGTTLSSIASFVFSNESDSTLSATLSLARSGASGTQSSLAGYFAGGSNASYRSTIDKITFSSGTTAALSAVLAVGTAYTTMCQNSLSGYKMGGAASGSLIERLTFSSDTISTISTTMPQSDHSYAGGFTNPN